MTTYQSKVVISQCLEVLASYRNEQERQGKKCGEWRYENVFICKVADRKSILSGYYSILHCRPAEDSCYMNKEFRFFTGGRLFNCSSFPSLVTLSSFYSAVIPCLCKSQLECQRQSLIEDSAGI